MLLISRNVANVSFVTEVRFNMDLRRFCGLISKQPPHLFYSCLVVSFSPVPHSEFWSASESV
jgi:hypothetical protein